MGCFQTRPLNEIPREELALRVMERSLGLHQHSSAEIDGIVRRALIDGKLNVVHYKRVLRRLKLKNYQVLLNCLQIIAKEGEYDARKLGILGVLLGSGDAATKSRLLCEYGEFKTSPQLSAHQIEKLLSDIAFVSIQVLGSLDELQGPPYISRLKSNMLGVVKQSTIDILQGKATSSHLELSYALTHHFSEWLSPSTVRQLCLNPTKQLMSSFRNPVQKTAGSPQSPAAPETGIAGLGNDPSNSHKQLTKELD